MAGGHCQQSYSTCCCRLQRRYCRQGQPPLLNNDTGLCRASLEVSAALRLRQRVGNRHALTHRHRRVHRCRIFKVFSNCSDL